jgi:integrase/recombinase XerD
MKPTVSLFLDTRVERKKGYPLTIIVRQSRNVTRIYGIGFYFKSDKDYQKLVVNQTKDPFKDTWNAIRAQLDKAERVIDKMMPFFSFEQFKEQFFHKATLDVTVDSTSLLSVLARISEKYRRNHQHEMVKKLSDSVDSIFKFVRHQEKEVDNLPMGAITPKFCREYEDWMVAKSKTSTRNGAGINLRHIRILFNYAITSGIIPAEWYPFKRKHGERSAYEDAYVIPNERKRKQFLHPEEVLSLAKTYKFSTEAQRKAHFAWLVSFYCNGCNAADFLNFKYNNIQDGFIVYYRHKIKTTTRADSKPIKVVLSPELLSIIKEFGNPPDPDNYIFPVYKPGMTPDEMMDVRKKFTTGASKSMKHLAKHLGLEKNLKLSNARHSVANILRKNNVNREIVKDIFGHTSMTTLDYYYDEFDSHVLQSINKDILSLDAISNAINKKENESKGTH